MCEYFHKWDLYENIPLICTRCTFFILLFYFEFDSSWLSHVGSLLSSEERKRVCSWRVRHLCHIMPTLFMTSKRRITGHKMADLTAVYLRLSNVDFFLNKLDNKSTGKKQRQELMWVYLFRIPFLPFSRTGDAAWRLKESVDHSEQFFPCDTTPGSPARWSLTFTEAQSPGTVGLFRESCGADL